MPDALAAWLGRRAGDLGYAVLGRRRRLAHRNLALAFPDLPDRARRRIARRSFQHLGLVFLEGCAVLGRSGESVTRRITLEGLDHLDGVMAREGRALVVTAHLGNWELLSLAPLLTGYPLTVVARALDSAALGAWAGRLRRTAGVEVVDKRAALRPILEALRRGRLVGVLLDQNATRREGIFVPFFGREASTSRAVATLALRTRTPVIPAFTRRLAPGHHEIAIGPPLPLPPTSDAAAVLALTAACTRAIEEAVRATPDQWLWSHDRWRTRPPDASSSAPGDSSDP
jgi:KDO2-lipid IV(A) lauroyltransferase